MSRKMLTVSKPDTAVMVQATSKPPARKKKQRKPASVHRFAVMNEFLDCTVADLTRSQALVWLVLFRDTRNGTARTSMQDIARRIGTSRRRTQDAINALISMGLVDRVRRGGINQGPSVYIVKPKGHQ